MSENFYPDEYDQEWNVVNYNSYDSASLGTSEDGDLVHGYGEDGDLASVAFDQDSNTLIVSDSETPAVQVPTETSTSSSDAHREDYAAPPALPDTGSHVNSRSGMVTMPCPAHGTSVYPYRVRVGDESCGAEYIEYADVPDDNLPEVSNGSSEDSPQLDDTSERSIPIRSQQDSGAPVAAFRDSNEELAAAVEACNLAEHQAQRLNQENQRLDMYQRVLIQQISQLQEDKTLQERQYQRELQRCGRELWEASKGYGRALLAEGDCNRLFKENEVLKHRIIAATQELEECKKTLAQQHEAEEKHAQVVADKMRLAAEVELKTKQSKELVAVIRRLLYLVHTRLMDDAVDCEIQNIYHEISGILYPRDPVAH